MPIIQKNIKSIYGLENALSNITSDISGIDVRVTELEHRTFQQSTTPVTGVNAGDIWLDTSDDILKVYREYPYGSGVFRWEPLIYKWDDTVDGGLW